MKLTYTLTFTDYKAALTLHRRQKISRRILPYLWPFVTVICLIITIILSVEGLSNLRGIFIALAGGGLAGSITRPIVYFFHYRKCFKQLFPPTRSDRSSSIDIDEERIFSSVPGVGESKLYWPGVLAFAQDEKITLLYTAETKFLFFPTAALSSDQRVELNDLVARNIVKRKL